MNESHHPYLRNLVNGLDYFGKYYGLKQNRESYREYLLDPEQRRFYNKQIPARYKRLFLDALFSADCEIAIAFNCLYCKKWQPDDVVTCDTLTCSLWPHRPV